MRTSTCRGSSAGRCADARDGQRVAAARCGRGVECPLTLHSRTPPHCFGQVADRDRRQGKTGEKGELLRMKRNIQMHLHTAASPRLYRERNGTPRVSMESHVSTKLAPLPVYTPRRNVAERWLPRNLVDTEDDEGPRPQPNDSVFSRPNRLGAFLQGFFAFAEALVA